MKDPPISDNFNFWFTVEYLMLSLQCCEPVVNALFCSLPLVQRCYLAAKNIFIDLVGPLTVAYAQNLKQYVGHRTKQIYWVSYGSYMDLYQQPTFLLTFNAVTKAKKEFSISAKYMPNICLEYVSSCYETFKNIRSKSQAEWLSDVVAEFNMYLLVNRIDHLVLSTPGWRWTECEGGFYIGDQQQHYQELYRIGQMGTAFELYTRSTDSTVTIQVWPALVIDKHKFEPGNIDDFFSACQGLINCDGQAKTKL